MLLERMIRAARLDPDLYYEVERDQNATGQAFVVVLIVALFPLIVGVLPLFGSPWGAGFGLQALFNASVGAVGSWLVWSAIAAVVGARMGGKAPLDGVMRPMAFAYTPGVLRVFTLVPGLAWPVSLVTGIWIAIASVIAVREAMDFATRKAVVTVVVTTAIAVVVDFILCKLTGMTFSAVGFLLSPLQR